MSLLTRVDAALENTKIRIEHSMFERFAVRALGEVYGAVLPVPGGSDWGVDAYLKDDGKTIVAAVTSARSFKGAKENLRKSMRSIKDHGLPHRRIASVSLAALNRTNQEKLKKVAEDEGFTLADGDIWERSWVANGLLRDKNARAKLLGLGAEPYCLLPFPPTSRFFSLDEKLIGRDDALTKLIRIEQDTVVCGVPGVGKSTLVAHLPGAMFIDGTPAVDRIIDDLYDARPKIVVIDDAARREEAARALEQARRNEPNLVFRIILICWPGEEPTLTGRLMSDVVTFQVPPLKRETIAEIVLAQANFNDPWLHTIVAQSYGRPGWAKILARFALSSKDWRKVADGSFIREELHRYFQTNTQVTDAGTLLGTLALIGNFTREDVRKLGKLVFGNPAHATSILNSASVSGFVDKDSEWGDPRMSIKPDRLAYSLAAEEYFQKTASTLSLEEVSDAFPAALESIALTLIRLKQMGVPEVAPNLKNQIDLVLESHAYATEFPAQLASLGGKWEEYAIFALRESIAGLSLHGHTSLDLLANTSAEMLVICPTNTMVRNIIDICIDASRAGIDTKKFIIDTFSTAIPESLIRNSTELLSVSLECATEHFGASLNETEQELLLNLTSVLAKPHWDFSRQKFLNPREFEWGTLSVPPDIVPLAGRQLNDASVKCCSDVPSLEELTRVVSSWLRAARGLNDGLGQLNVPLAIQAEALELCKLFVPTLIQKCESHPALVAMIVDHIADLDILIPRLHYSELVKLMFLDNRVEETDEDLHGEHDYTTKLEQWVQNHPNSAEMLCSKLSIWAEESQLVDYPRIKAIPLLLQISAKDPQERVSWVQAALDAGLVDDVYLLLRDTPVESFTPDLVNSLLETRHRHSVIRRIFGAPDHSCLHALILGHLSGNDTDPVYYLALVGDCSNETLLAFLNHGDPSISMIAAVAMLNGRKHGETPCYTDQAWDSCLAVVIRGVDFFSRDIDDYKKKWALAGLASKSLEVFTETLVIAVRQKPRNPWIDFNLWQEALSELSAEKRREIWRKVKDTECAPLLRALANGNTEWIIEALDQHLVTADEVQYAFSHRQGGIDLSDLARILVPRGIDPSLTAEHSEPLSGTGFPTEKLQSALEEFRAMRKSQERPIHLVGTSGLSIFEEKYQKAFLEETHRNLNGEL